MESDQTTFRFVTKCHQVQPYVSIPMGALNIWENIWAL